MKLRKKSVIKIQYRDFAGLWIKKLLGYKTFRINHATICTKDGIIIVGGEYQYKEACMLERAVIEDISFSKFYIHLKVRLVDSGRRFTCYHLLTPIGYSGMWHIWDKGHYDIEEWRRDHSGPIDRDFLDSIPTIYI